MKTIGLVVHPSRAIDTPLEILRSWAAEHGVELVQLRTDDGQREVAPYGTVETCDLVVAIGGDGTVLWALGAAEPTATPVLGVARGSLGALTTTKTEELAEALDAFASGNWARRVLPALSIAVNGKHVKQAVNDCVLLRRTGQLQVDLSVDGELYARLAGDGVIVATALGSTAYSMAAGGPVLPLGTSAFVATPLAPHGGNTPPLVVPGDAELHIDAHPGFDGFDIEVDGHVKPAMTAASYVITLTEARSALVCLTDPGRGFEALRRRGIIMDGPRVLARDRRDAEATADRA